MGAAEEQLVAEYRAAWNAHDVDKVMTFFTDDCEYEDAIMREVVRGKPEMRAYLVEWLAVFPDLSFEVKNHYVGPEGGGAEFTFSGTHTNPVMGLPATNKPFTVRGASILELRDGKIRREADYWDAASFMTQIGMMPT
jgi:steroid delta-isomerase-like uncharacterized protein